MANSTYLELVARTSTYPDSNGMDKGKYHRVGFFHPDGEHGPYIDLDPVVVAGIIGTGLGVNGDKIRCAVKEPYNRTNGNNATAAKPTSRKKAPKKAEVLDESPF